MARVMKDLETLPREQSPGRTNLAKLTWEWRKPTLEDGGRHEGVVCVALVHEQNVEQQEEANSG